MCQACKPIYLDRLKNGLGPTDDLLARDGDKVVMGRKARLPDICFKCGDPACTRIKRKLQWHHPAFYLFILLNLLIYAIVAMCVSKKAEVEVPLCAKHKARRKMVIGIGWAGVGVLVLSIVIGVAISPKGGGLIPLGFLVFVACLVCVGIINTAGRSARISDKLVWLKGAGPTFLAALPVHSGQKS